MNKSKRSIWTLALLFSLFTACFLATSASAEVGLDGLKVRLSDYSIKAGDNFDVNITLEQPDEDRSSTDVDVEITVDGVLVHKKTHTFNLVNNQDYSFVINSDSFEIEDEGKFWKENLLSYACGKDKNVEVTVSGDVESTTKAASDTLDIKASDDNELTVTLDPETPTLDEKFTVKVIDQDEDDLNNAEVKLTWIDDKNGNDEGVWDTDDKKKSSSTDSDGETTFKISSDMGKTAYGKYQLDVWKSGFCKVTKELSLYNQLNISDPEPASPQVNEAFKVKVLMPGGKPATGLIVSLSPGNIKSKVLSDGYASFTLNSPGTYSLSAGGGSTGFEEVLKVVKVSTAAQLSLRISPDTASINKPVIISVESDGAPIEGATVKVTPPGGSEQTLPGTTSSSGTISYTPAAAGDYAVKASKGAYDVVTDTFSVKNNLQIELPPASDMKKGSQVVVTVKDQSGSPVADAQVSIAGLGVSGTTDPSGKYSFTLSDVGSFNVVVKKTGFADGTASMSLSGQLAVKVDRKEITLSEQVKITIVDSDGKPVDAATRITGPSTQDTSSDREFAYTPKKAGDYRVETSKAGYSGGSETFKVKPLTVAVSYAFNDDKLTLNVTAGGKPVQGVTLKVTGANATSTVSTDSSGSATVAAAAAGTYAVEVAPGDYTGSPVSAVKNPPSVVSDYWVPILVVLVALVLIGIFGVVLLSLVYRRGGGAKTSFKKSPGSRLGG